MRLYKVKDGIVYDSDTADVIYVHDSFMGNRRVLGVTPEGNYFIASYGGALMGWVIFPYTRLMMVWRALEMKAPDEALERLGLELIPEPDVPADKPYEGFPTIEPIASKNTRFTNKFIHTCEFLFKNPDGRYFVYDGMILLSRFTFEERRPMTQRKALLWAFKNYAPWAVLEMLGYVRTDEEREYYRNMAK